MISISILFCRYSSLDVRKLTFPGLTSGFEFTTVTNCGGLLWALLARTGRPRDFGSIFLELANVNCVYRPNRYRKNKFQLCVLGFL